jgi:hypothetical protein
MHAHISTDDRRSARNPARAGSVGHAPLTSNPGPHKRPHTRWMLATALAAIATFSPTPIAHATGRHHRARLDSTMFAAEIGTTTTGATVFAGAIIDPKLHRGAIVYHTSGGTTLNVGFQEFFALGSIKGRGSVTLVPGVGGEATLTGAFKITGGTARYRHARGQFTTGGIFNSDGTVMATLKGSLTY